MNYVSPRAKQVWTMLAGGVPTKAIGDTLGISQKGVEHHKHQITKLFKIQRNDAMFYRLAVAFGLVDKQKPIK